MRGGARSLGVALGLLVCLLAAAPAGALEWRGIVEGPYGRTWTHAERERILRWMPAHGFGAYIHAPKHDLYQRTHWRDPYPAAEMAEFEEEIAMARGLGVEWIPNLSPALPLVPTPTAPDGAPSAPLCFSCPEDLDAVLAKLDPFVTAGSSTVMISFDDVIKTLHDPRDLAAYGGGEEGYGRANGDFLTRLAAALAERAPGTRLLTVGADYSGTADTPYLAGLRSTLAQGIGVMWTGPSIPSQDFTAADAAAYGELIGRRPIVWENWTNTDTTGSAIGFGPARIFLGPYRRRAEVTGELDGFFFNPANDADLNLLPLATAGAWMAAPAAYDARSSWLAAVDELAGPDAGRRDSLRAFAETSHSTKLDPVEAPTFTEHSADLIARYDGPVGDWPAPRRSLERELGLVLGAEEALRDLPNRGLYEGLSPFFEPARVSAGAARAGARLLAAERPTLAVRRDGTGFAGRVRPPDPAGAARARARFSEALARARTSFPFTYGWRSGFGFDIPPYEAGPNPLHVFLDRVGERDRAWMPRSGDAASSVTLELDGAPVSVAGDGTFTLPGSACGGTLTATDGAGGRTSRPIPAC